MRVFIVTEAIYHEELVENYIEVKNTIYEIKDDAEKHFNMLKEKYQKENLFIEEFKNSLLSCSFTVCSDKEHTDEIAEVSIKEERYYL